MDSERKAATLDSDRESAALGGENKAETLDDWRWCMTCEPEYPCLAKHIESNDTYYVDLAPALGTGETVSSLTSVTCTDAALTAAVLTVLSAATTVTTTERDNDGNTTTRTYVIAANKGVSFTLAGGTVGNGCGVITVKYVKSTGKVDAVAVKVLVYGEDV